MKTSFLTTGGTVIGLTIILTYSLVVLTSAAFRKRYHPGAAMNLAQGIVLAGKLLAGILLISGIFAPVRDYLFIASASGGLYSAASWSFLLICCCIMGVTYLLTAAIEGVLSRRIFKGQALAVEMQENNLAVAAIRAVLITIIAFALLFSMGLFIQSFIPVPAIPTIG
jgi:hypothetical protein